MRISARNELAQLDRPPGSTIAWLSGRMGDVYPHETAISHIRRLLATKFVCMRIDETVAQFQRRMRKVQDYMNSNEFAAETGTGLMALGKHMYARCEELTGNGGARLPY